jgi:inosose dehydratase
MGTPQGLVDFPALIASMKEHNYRGWIVAESDQTPNPSESAMLNNWYIKHALSNV